MRYKQLLAAVSCIGLFGLSQNIWAACHLSPDLKASPTLDLDLGVISVDPKLPVGGVISTSHFPLAKAGVAPLQCDASGGAVTGVIHGQQLSPLANVYQTNIKGVGIRFSHDDQQPINFPYQAAVQSSMSNILGQQLTVELVKTAQLTGTGALAAGVATSYYLDGDGPNRPILTTRLRANTTVLMNQTCGFNDQSAQQTVEMGSIKAAQLTAVGQTVGTREFSVGFVCPAGYTPQSITVRFNYQRDLDALAANVIQNSQAAGYAKGIGIALYAGGVFNNLAIAPGDSLGFVGMRDFLPELKLKASYYKTRAEITPGMVYASMMLNMSYQ